MLRHCLQVIFYTPQIFSYVGRAKGLRDTVVVGAGMPSIHHIQDMEIAS